MLPKDNPESWRKIHEFIDEFPDDDYWSEWKSMVRSVLTALEARGLGSQFRIGQAMHDIILSTSESHGLASEPRVTLQFYPKEQIVRVAYGYTYPDFAQPLSEERVAPSVAVSSVLRHLRRLWIETKPETQIPDAITAA